MRLRPFELRHNLPEKRQAVADFGLLISAAKADVVASIDAALATLGLTAAQYRVVMILAYNGRTTLANLSAEMDYDRGAMSRLLSRLEGKGLLDKSPSATDKRSMYLSLSAKGNALLPNIRPKVNDVFEKALGGFSYQERDQLSTLLLRFLNNLKEISNKG
ncbi:MarR family winged helix-turn-helix transcriptional regulator [Marinomonas pollencensis]|uniref:MarR family transcriptional regulator n=1 Tax=Marinomonas pollencensis TaxID=491954 RepID=A0A3E0DHK6_9GAMM|nr:MarR family transcriptional regulator [Marinomonas pollencensis]REG82207.1 MarR family transcriptional regulator [Marinomonas pollencensis]